MADTPHEIEMKEMLISEISPERYLQYAEQLSQPQIPADFDAKSIINELNNIAYKNNYHLAAAIIMFTTAKNGALETFTQLSKTSPVDIINNNFKSHVNTFYSKGLLALEYINSSRKDRDVIKDERMFRASLNIYFGRFLQAVIDKGKNELLKNIEAIEFVENKFIDLAGESLLKDKINELKEIRSSDQFIWRMYEIISKAIISSIKHVYGQQVPSTADAITAQRATYNPPNITQKPSGDDQQTSNTTNPSL